jgi:hypothetical protein
MPLATYTRALLSGPPDPPDGEVPDRVVRRPRPRLGWLPAGCARGQRSAPGGETTTRGAGVLSALAAEDLGGDVVEMQVHLPGAGMPVGVA